MKAGAGIADVIDSLPSNPLPDAFVIEARPSNPATLDALREEATRVLRTLEADDMREIKLLQEHLHDAVGQIIYDRTRRRPMILPVVIEV